MTHRDLPVERLAAAGFGMFIGTTAMLASRARHRERRLRHAELVGNNVIDADEHTIEYRLHRPAIDTPDTPIIVCENGLGAPLECWDWVAQFLGAHSHVLQYHRSGYGATSSPRRPAELIRHLLTHEFDGDQLHARPILIVSHSIGGMATREALTDSAWLRSRVRGVCLVDSTDPVQLSELRSVPERYGKVTQSMLLERLGAYLGTTALTNPILDEVDYRSSVQDRFRRFSIDTATIRTACAELDRYSREAARLAQLRIPNPLLISAERSHEGEGGHRRAQQTLADRIGAPRREIESAGHRSILGYRAHGQLVAEHVSTWSNSIDAPTADKLPEVRV